jgi:nitroreductase
MAFCGPGAISSDTFPYGDFMELDACDIDTGSLKNLLLSRRSVRRYIDRDVPDETIDELLDVATYAGTGSNSQSVEFVVIKDVTLLGELEKVTLDTGWNAGLKYLDRQGVMRALRVVLGSERAGQFKRYHDVFRYRMDSNELKGTIFRNAPVVILAHDDKRTPSGCENCAIALRNVETLASSMGLGTCWVGLFTFVALKRHRTINRMLGISPSRRVHGALMLGYPRYDRRVIIPRRKRSITRL